MTASTTAVLVCLIIACCNMNDGYYDGVVIDELVYIVFSIFQMVFVELYMRYLDKVNFTKNEITKNKL